MGSKKKAQIKARRKQQKDRARRLEEVLGLVEQHGPRKKLPPVRIKRDA